PSRSCASARRRSAVRAPGRRSTRQAPRSGRAAERRARSGLRPRPASASATEISVPLRNSRSSGASSPQAARLPKKPRPNLHPSSSRKATTATVARDGGSRSTASIAATMPSAPAKRPPAATGTIGFFLFANLGLERASASVGALVQGIAPVLIAVFAVAFLRERLTGRIVAGIALALAGAAVLAWGAIHVTSALGLVFLFL